MKTTRLSRLRAAVVLPFLAALAACTGTSDGNTQTTTIEQMKVIGATGGTIALENGVTVTVPAGAIANDTQISVKWVSDAAAFATQARPEGIDGAIAGAVVLTPHGTQFSEPVQVSVPTTLTSDDFVFLRLADDNATAWTAEGSAKRVGSTLQFSVLEFSTYSAVAVTAGACPCWNAAEMEAFNTANPSQFQSFYPQYGVGLAIVQNRAGSAYLRLSGSVGPGGQTSNYACERVGANPTKVSPITSTQASACYALLRARFVEKKRSNLNVGAYTTTLTTGQTAQVELTITPPGGTASKSTVTLTPTDNLMWANGAFVTGTTVSATVVSSPAGFTCTPATASSTLGTENVAVLINCQPIGTSTCPTVAANQSAPGYLNKVAAMDVALKDDFSAPVLDEYRWRADSSDDESFEVTNNAFLTKVTNRQNMGIGGVNLMAGNGTNDPLSGSLTGTIEFTTPDLSEASAAQMSLSLYGDSDASIFFQIAAQGMGDGMGGVTFDGTYDVRLSAYDGSGGSGVHDSETIKLGAMPNTLSISYDSQTGDVSVTVTEVGGTNVTVTAKQLLGASYELNLQMQALPNATVSLPMRSWAILDINTNQTIHYPEAWSMGAPGLSFNGADYTFSSEGEQGALWFAGLDQLGEENVYPLVSSKPAAVTFDDMALTVFARLCSLTVENKPVKATFYSAIADDATFKTKLDAQLAVFGATPVVIDAKATTFTKQNDGTYSWNLTCP